MPFWLPAAMSAPSSDRAGAAFHSRLQPEAPRCLPVAVECTKALRPPLPSSLATSAHWPLPERATP